jgi:hypothetical protein
MALSLRTPIIAAAPAVAALGLVFAGALGVTGAPLALPAEPVGPNTGPAALDLIGQIGGNANGVAIVGGTAYLSVGPRVWVVDVADPSKPRVTGMSAVLPGAVLEVWADTRRVIALGKNGAGNSSTSVLTLFEPGGAGSLRMLGQAAITVERAGGMAVDGSVVAVTGWGMQLVDISNPAHPAVIEVADALGPDRGRYLTAVLGNGHAYVFASGQDGTGGSLQVLDLADIQRPRRVGELTVGALSAVLAGQVLVAADVRDGEPWSLVLLDVMDPRRPRVLSTTRLTQLTSGVVDLVAGGGFLYLAGGLGELMVWDASDPTRVQLEVNLATGAGVHALAVDAGRLYVTTESNPSLSHNASSAPPGLVTYDATVHQTLPEIGRLAVMPGNLRDVVLVGRRAYVVAASQLDPTGGIWVLDLADPERPVTEAYIPISVGWSSLAHDGRYLYRADGNGMQVIDLSEPARPRLRGLVLDTAEHSLLAAGRGALYMMRGQHLTTIDVRDPDHPNEVSRTPLMTTLQSGFADIDLVDGLLYLIDSQGGLVTMDVREPLQPRVARNEFIGLGNKRVATDGRRALLTGAQGLVILDVAALSNVPRRLGQLSAAKAAGAAALDDRTAFLGDAAGTLLAVDLATPGEPKAIASLALPRIDSSQGTDYVTDLDLVDDLVVVATNVAGLALVRRSGDGAPPPEPHPLAARAYLPAVLTGARLPPRTAQLKRASEWFAAANGIGTVGENLMALRVERTPGKAGAQARLVALDFSDPAVKPERGQSEALLDPQAGEAAASIAVAGELAYVTFGSGDIWVLDVRDVARPQLVGHVDLDSKWRGLLVSGGRLYLYGAGGVRICDLANPLSPRPIGDIRPPVSAVTPAATGLAVTGDVALVTYLSYGETDPGLVAIDIRDPANPRQLGTALIGSAGAAVVTDGRLAYVAPSAHQHPQPTLSGGLIMLDVRDPAHIRELGHRLDRGLREVCQLAFVGDGILVGAAETGTYFWDVSEPDLPRELAATHGWPATCGVGSVLATAGERAYVTGLSAYGVGISGLRLDVAGR